MEGSVVSEGLMCKYRTCDSPMEGSVGPVLTYSGEEGSMNSSSLWAMLFISSSWDVDSGEREVRSSVTSSLSVLPGLSLFEERERLLLDSDLVGVGVRELELSLGVFVELGLTLGVLVELGLEVEATDAALLGVFVGHGS